jgi:hypothetical protein
MPGLAHDDDDDDDDDDHEQLHAHVHERRRIPRRGPDAAGQLGELLPVLRLITVLLNTILQGLARRGSLELPLALELTTVLLNTILLNSRRRQAQASRGGAQQHSSVSAGCCTSSPARRTAPTG